MEAFALGPALDDDASPTSWTVCRVPKPLNENRVVAAGCLAPGAADGVGNPVTLTIPTDACALYGPDPPQPAPGAPPTRPRDPDATGGYFQPVTAVLGESIAVALDRVSCGLRDASLAVARAYQAAYRPNQNPTIAGLAFSVDGTAVDPATIAPGARVTIEVTWTPDSSETFPVFDRATGSLVQTQEALTASWYVTGGELARAAAEVTDPTVTSATAEWVVAQPSTVEVVVVLRDSRGGTDVARALAVIGAGMM
jgi:hypothetical protein